MPHPIQITLCPFTEPDRRRLLAWRNRPDVAASMYTDHEISGAEHDAWFDCRMADNPKRHWILAVDGEPIGMIGLTDIEQGRGLLGHYIGEPQYRGLGFGAAGECLLLDKAFIELGLHKVCCEVLATNSGAIALHERLGFTREVILPGRVVKNGSPRDVVGLGLMAEQWFATRIAHIASLEAKGIGLDATHSDDR